MDPKFQEELKSLFQKYGLKADDSKSDEDLAAEAKAKAEAQESKIVADVSERVATKLAEMIANNKGITANADKKELESTIKTKIFTKWAGMQEVSYPTDLKSLSKDEKIVTFFKALVYSRNDPASEQVLRALVEGTDSEGGFLVPQELRTEVFRVLPDQTIMRNLARVLPMTTDLMKINSLSARPQAYWTSEYQSSSTKIGRAHV